MICDFIALDFETGNLVIYKSQPATCIYYQNPRPAVMQAGNSWNIYGMANNHAMKCLILRADVLLAS